MPNLRKSPPAKDDHAIRQDFTNPSVFGKDPEPKVQAPDGGSGVVITVRQIRLETKSVRIYLKNPSLTVFSWVELYRTSVNSTAHSLELSWHLCCYYLTVTP